MEKHQETQKEDLKWYAASAIFVTRYKDAPDEVPLAEERVYLIGALTDDDALNEAESLAKHEASGSPFEYEGREAFNQYAGIRKLITLRQHVSDRDIDSDAPRNGTEVTFSYFKLQNPADLHDLVDGETVQVVYIADRRQE